MSAAMAARRAQLDAIERDDRARDEEKLRRAQKTWRQRHVANRIEEATLRCKS